MSRKKAITKTTFKNRGQKQNGCAFFSDLVEKHELY